MFLSQLTAYPQIAIENLFMILYSDHKIVVFFNVLLEKNQKLYCGKESRHGNNLDIKTIPTLPLSTSFLLIHVTFLLLRAVLN